jgi:hypothetical protein
LIVPSKFVSIIYWGSSNPASTDGSAAHSTKRSIKGMVRFYLDGKCSPSEQDWPECLDSCKSELLEEVEAALV